MSEDKADGAAKLFGVIRSEMQALQRDVIDPWIDSLGAVKGEDISENDRLALAFELLCFMLTERTDENRPQTDALGWVTGPKVE